MDSSSAALVMLDILASTKNKTAAEVAVEIISEAPKISGQEVLYAVPAGKHCRTSQSDCA